VSDANQVCAWKHCTNLAIGRGEFCSRSCKNKTCVDRFRREQKRKAVEYLGGKCECCGYDKCLDALEFHHRDPNAKDFGISSSGITYKWERLRVELDKCMLVCSNCHKEIHALVGYKSG